MEKEFCTLEDAVEFLTYIRNVDYEDDTDCELDICQLPPDENDRVTDEENIDEEKLEAVIPKDVSGQLCLIMNTKSTPDNIDESIASCSSSSINEPQNSKRMKVGTKTKKTNKKGNFNEWVKSSTFLNPIPSESLTKINVFSNIASSEPLELFFEFLPQQYLEYLAAMTKTYSLQHGNGIHSDWKDIAQFFGILLLSGYHSLPNENLYWSSAEDVAISIVPSVMSRNRFKELKRYFHVMDNSMLKKGDKLGKIQPIYDQLNSSLKKFGIFHNSLSIDESMVPYYGHHSCKMFIRGKPIRFGFKIWMLCSSNGYPYKMEIYAGKKQGVQSYEPLGARVVNDLLAAVVNPLHVEVFFDNFFSSYKLFHDLAKKNFKATGTLRQGRTGQCPLKSTKEMKKLERGEYDFWSDGVVFVCGWNDNAAVTVGSNHYTHEPLQNASRYLYYINEYEIC